MSSPIAELQAKGKAAKAASRKLAFVNTDVKNKALRNIAQDLLESKAEVLAANKKDYDAAQASGMNAAMLDRLRLSTPPAWRACPRTCWPWPPCLTPLGEVFDMRTLPNGLIIGRKRVPLGVIGALYEARPNVTIDIPVLCLKSGNAVILRGGKETIHSNLALVKVVQAACARAGRRTSCLQDAISSERN